MTVKPDPIMIRMPRDGSQPFAEIVWPYEPASYQPGDVTCWGYVGQHGGADLAGWIRETRPATPAECAAALRQWRYEGPGRGEAECPVRILVRRPSWAVLLAAHRAYLGRA